MFENLTHLKTILLKYNKLQIYVGKAEGYFILYEHIILFLYHFEDKLFFIYSLIKCKDLIFKFFTCIQKNLSLLFHLIELFSELLLVKSFFQFVFLGN